MTRLNPKLLRRIPTLINSTSLRDASKLKKIEAILEDMWSDGGLLKSLDRPIRKQLNVEVLKQEQNFKPVDKKSFFKKIDDLNIEESIDDLIAMI